LQYYALRDIYRKFNCQLPTMILLTRLLL